MHLPVRIRVARSSSKSGAPDGLVEHTRRSAPSAEERLFALGTRTLADLIAPAGVEVRRDHLQLDAQYVRALVVTGYPRTVAAGWLAPLVDELDLPLEVSLHIRPLASGEMVRTLGLQIAKLESSRRVDLVAQRIDFAEQPLAFLPQGLDRRRCGGFWAVGAHATTTSFSRTRGRNRINATRPGR